MTGNHVVRVRELSCPQQVSCDLPHVCTQNKFKKSKKSWIRRCGTGKGMELKKETVLMWVGGEGDLTTYPVIRGFSFVF